ncbi:MAG: TonB-dependent receptor [Candidatus Eisenbacteria bacterium]|nr:TonB-dependent receptor [Candidatus Eisenbacteria bacterium]
MKVRATYLARSAPSVAIWSLFAAATVSVAAQPTPGIGAALRGAIHDAVSGAPVIDAHLHLARNGIPGTTDEAGAFAFEDLAAGPDTLWVGRIGYAERMIPFELAAHDTLRLALVLEPVNLSLDPVLVEGARGADPEMRGRSAVSLSGEALRERLAGTIAESMENEPGLATRSMGPAPSRPVLRGLGGNRLLVLEDGERTGDLSASSADHAVTIEPMTAEGIEVIRGPRALLYGSNVLGGVVNVEHETVPLSLPSRLNGNLGLTGQSVNTGGSGSLAFRAPLDGIAPFGSIALRGDGSWREARDTQTPGGELRNTEIRTRGASLGISQVGERSTVGIAGGLYRSDYGIPGGFLGGHAHGVDIELDRRFLEAAVRLSPREGPVSRLDLKGSYSRYYHEELESNDVCGVAFGVVSYHASAVARFSRTAPHLVGLWIEHRDFATGCLSFIPPTTERSAALFTVHEATIGPWEVGVGGRVDLRAVRPEEGDTTKAGVVRARDFSGVSASLRLSRSLSATWSTELLAQRSFSPPALEELFSEGPHLAAYSYEVGNADLDPETGLGVDLGLNYRGAVGELRFSGFWNQFERYTYARDTGEIEYGAGEDGALPRYRFVGRDARLAGLELSGAAHLWVDWEGNLSWVEGSLPEGDRPLPAVPPLHGLLRADLRHGEWRYGLTARGAARQSRTGEFEDPTAGYLVFDARVALALPRRHALHEVSLSVDNVTDREYRNHLSRIRSILPEAGRDLRLSYRTYF